MARKRYNQQQRNNSRNQAQQTGGSGAPSQPVTRCGPKPWELTVTVKTAAKYGLPSPTAAIVFASQLAGKSAPMSGPISGTVRWTGHGNIDTMVHAEHDGGWTTKEAKRVRLSAGAKQHIDLELIGVWIEFQLVDAANPPAPVKNESAKVFDEHGKLLEQITSNDQGVVRLENVAPQKYQVSFINRYDLEWNPY